MFFLQFVKDQAETLPRCTRHQLPMDALNTATSYIVYAESRTMRPKLAPIPSPCPPSVYLLSREDVFPARARCWRSWGEVVASFTHQSNILSISTCPVLHARLFYLFLEAKIQLWRHPSPKRIMLSIAHYVSGRIQLVCSLALSVKC